MGTTELREPRAGMRWIALKKPDGTPYMKEVRQLPNLHPFQREDTVRCLQRKATLLNSAIGSGKTWVVLAYIQGMIDVGYAESAVVVTKKSTIRPTWAAIMDKHFPMLTYEVLTDKSRPQRAAIWQKRPRPDVYLMNYELTINRMDRVFLDDMFESSKILLCADECHYLRNVETDRHQQWVSMADRAAGILGATATPLQTSPDDWYGMLSMLRYPLEPYHRWKFKWCRCIETWVPGAMGPRRIWTPVEFLPKRAKELREIALKWTIRRPPGVVQLPGLTEETRLVELTPEERKIYN
jgi:superfamily II DNA or RNA helicase